MMDACSISQHNVTGKRLAIIALILALVGTIGSLALSMALGLKPCPLCFYQRSFIMATAAVLLVGLMAHGVPAATLSLLALPLATCGLAVAGFHVFLELSGKLECPSGVWGLGTAPQQSLALGTLLSAVLGASAFAAT